MEMFKTYVDRSIDSVVVPLIISSLDTNSFIQKG